LSPTTGPYCSPECLSYAQPASSSRLLASPQSPPDAYRIHRWAKAIPPYVPAGAPALPFADHLCSPPAPVSPSDPRPSHPHSRRQPTPKLIERTAVSTPLPTLCVSSPAQVRPSHHSRTSSRTFSQAKTNTTGTISEASTSLTSLLSEPMVVTPDEDCSFGTGISALVRSWVHRDGERSVVAREVFVEKPQDYFSSPPPRARKPSSRSSSEKAKLTLSPPSPPVAQRKPRAENLPRTYELASTPTETHTPTPVIFPSSRAVELDWDEDAEGPEIIIAPRAQYHPAYRTKSVKPCNDAPCARAPSLASSVSSTGSSILLMAPKRWDSARGRLTTSIA